MMNILFLGFVHPLLPGFSTVFAKITAKSWLFEVLVKHFEIIYASSALLYCLSDIVLYFLTRAHSV